MTEKKWTPGPWKAFHNGHYFDIKCGESPGAPATHDYNPSFAAVTHNIHYEHTVDSNEANAYLIAAAPELYEALEQAVTSMLDSGYATDSVAVMAAKQALAKAQGDQS